ncbi:MAG: hypothetical protein HQM08_09205 [Candidatus Riflebacteria bacterium]|nr:hypothetical protein [Candidatus Riflebacteria bacterium]
MPNKMYRDFPTASNEAFEKSPNICFSVYLPNFLSRFFASPVSLFVPNKIYRNFPTTSNRSNGKKVSFRLISSALLFLLAFCTICAAEQFDWPMKGPFLIGANFSDFQNYADIPYWHGGIDIRAPYGTEVFSPVSGIVRISTYRIDASNSPRKFEYLRSEFPSTSHDRIIRGLDSDSQRYVEVSVVDKNGNNWMFRHIDAKSIPSKLFSLPGTTQNINSGEFIGRIIRWTESVYPSAETYNHLHLEILDPEGNYLNPAIFMKPLLDTEPPVIKGLWIVKNQSEEVLGGVSPQIPIVSGKIDIVAQIEDTNNSGTYTLSPYSIKMGLWVFKNQTWKEISPIQYVVKFDKLPIKGDRTQMVESLYKKRIKFPDGMELKSEGNSKLRTFLYTLTSGDPTRGYKQENCLDLKNFSEDYYSLNVEASDLAGNTTTKHLTFKVQAPTNSDEGNKNFQ